MKFQTIISLIIMPTNTMSTNSEMQNTVIKMIMDKAMNRSLSDHTDYTITIDLGIEKICDLPVEVKLNIFWPPAEAHLKSANIRISADDIWVSEDDEIDQYTLFFHKFEKLIPDENMVGHLLQSCAQTLNQITFDKSMGKFVIPGSQYTAITLLFCEAFGVTNPTIKSQLDTCSVCYDKTLTKTSCGHVLCIPCWSSIERTQSEDDICSNKKCPICRKDLYF